MHYHHIIGAALFLALAHTIYTISYRLFFSPLAKFPGPKLCAITRLPFAWHTWAGDLVFWVHRLHGQYGAVVRVAPDELGYANAQAWQDIYHNKAALKDPKFYGETSNGVQEILRADNESHHRFRRTFAHAFADRSIKEQEPLIARYVDIMVHKLHEQGGQPVDMIRLFSLVAFDIIGDLAFGEPLDLLESPKYHYWIDTTWAAAKAFAVTRFARWYPWMAPLAVLAVPKDLMQQIEDNFAQCAERVDRRLATKTSRPDIWGLVLSQKGERQLSVPEMHANSQSLLLAGAETTATTLSSLLYFLTKNPEKLQTLITEVRGTFASDDEISLTDLTSLRYLYACIEETLRLVPPAPTGLPRVVPAQGMTICSETIPPKIIVSVSALAAVRSSQNFKDPNSFIPERWLKNPEFNGDTKAASQPFSAGNRNCVGQNLAYHELRLIAAKMLWHFDVQLSPESENWLSELKVHGVWEKKPLMVTMKARQ